MATNNNNKPQSPYDRDVNFKNVDGINRGWYYDLQLTNKITSCSLHPNTYTVDDGFTWHDMKDIGSSNNQSQANVGKTSENDRVSENSKTVGGGEPPEFAKYGIDPDDVEEPFPYSREPLCRSIVNEDFNITIANNWSEFGGDPVSEMWNTIKPLAPYAKDFISSLGEMVEQQNSMTAEEQAKYNDSYLAQGLGAIVSGLYEVAGASNEAGENIAVDYMNRNLVVQGTRFSYYNGTGVSFGNLVMKFTIFPSWRGGEFITVNDQVNGLYPYLVGKFVQEDFKKLGREKLEAKAKANGWNISGVLDKMSQLIGWQKPPAGFQADMKNVDNVQRGTFKLKFGPMYAFTNLVCSDASFNFSKQMVKNPTINVITGEGNKAALGGGLLSPLYCDISITLRPATKYSDDSLRTFVTGLNRIREMEETEKLAGLRLKSEHERLKTMQQVASGEADIKYLNSESLNYT